ncbi:competence type IV pilus minor pilin ComGD [Floricoccus penangensis]|uniref:competence type IV pilus minor pilin ComGD n=1 Tax=Floricoccus penangensis TaxID=1859475 RepID=UPI0009F2638B|nr:competence type IV pilus minor pilin ComGD [Floricoccus penangensis]URZ87456.1 competence protein [Floricoccus penangensis]
MKKIQIRQLRFRISAFTLLESLMSLFVISFILIVFTISFTNKINIIKGELFILRFERIYRDTQFQSMVRKQSNNLEIVNKKLLYLGKEVEIPNQVEFVNSYNIRFSEDGGNSSLQKIEIYLPYTKKKLNYQLYVGSGKYKKSIS